MNAKRAAAIVLGGGALAAWLAAAATSPHDAPAPFAFTPSPIDTRGAELAAEIARLNERLRPSAVPSAHPRNLFMFRDRLAVPAAPLVPPPAASPAVELPAASAASTFKLAGIAEDQGPDGPIRTAFVSGDGQLFVVKEGENVTARYRVAKIGADGIELVDTGDGSTRRLVWK
jgi:hypothetical protein